MCEIIDSETYLKCSHTIPTHLKYALKYCRAPNGVPFPYPNDARQMYPDRFCPVEDWGRLSVGFDLWCKDCEIRRRRRRRERVERMAEGGEEERGLLEEESEDEEDEEESDDEYQCLGVSIEEEEEAAPAGVVTIFQGCGCRSVVYRASKLQGCFEKKPALTQMVEKARRASGSAARHFGSPVKGTRTSVRLGYHTYRAPTPPTADKTLLRAHRAAEAEEFSVERRDMLICGRKFSQDRCGECERKWVLARIGGEGDVLEGYGFRSKKPMGLRIIPAVDGGMEDVKGERGEW
ncbi:hypothetical protein FQN54_004204 [Arachnomyces sp. PD_36]|nr:hypothetical protein FQN54_004204 [Arachnomyces sp. PD_36]